MCWAQTSPPKKEDHLGATLGLTPESKNLPVWTTPSLEARQQLAKRTQELAGSVFLVGNPGKGHGTAWVISREHRLLATNAHVADAFVLQGVMWALRHQSSQKWRVAKVWFHPGVRRFVSTGVSFRESDPKKGRVDPSSPDVAVLQLAPDGPDLPPPFILAGLDDLPGLFAQPVAMIGYPAHDTQGLPPDGVKPQATFHDGVISRLTDFRFNAGGPHLEQQFIQHTIMDWGGFSGSPIFLPTGKVVGLHNMARSLKGDFGDIRVIPHGIRVDCLLELLVHHKLTDKVAVKIDAARLDILRWFKEDRRDKDLRQAMRLMNQAHHCIYNTHEFTKGLELCDLAEKLAPQYPQIYRTRAGGYQNMNYYQEGISRADRLKNLFIAEANVKAFMQKQGSSDPSALLAYAGVKNNLGNNLRRPSHHELALEIAEKVASIPNLPAWQKADAISQQAHSFWYLDEENTARRLYNLAINTNPDGEVHWENRAAIGEGEQQRGDRDMANLLRKRSRLLFQSGNKEIKTIYDFKEKLTAKDDRDGRGCYYHLYNFEVEAGYFYQIDMKNPDFKNDGDLDPYLILRDDKNQLIRENDDGGGLPHSRLFFTAARSGNYRLLVTTFARGQVGNYHLVVKRLAQDKGP